MPVSATASPWWATVALQITGPSGLVGRTLTIEALTELIPCYPDGRRPRPRTVARRLGSVLRLVERGPNGSLSKGALYDVIARPQRPDAGRDDLADDEIPVDLDWISSSVERMTKEK